MRRVSALFFGSVLAAALGGCTFNPGQAGSSVSGGAGASGTGKGATGGTSLGNAGANGGGSSGASSGGGDIGTDAGCGQSNHGAMKAPGDLLLIQDKSGSMADDFNDQRTQCGQMCKWPVMRTALNTVMMMTQASVNWGLQLFSTDGTCAATNTNDIAPAPNNAMAVSAVLNRTNPGGNTPTRFAVESGVQYLMGLTDANPKYILLATDGQPNCCVPGNGITCGAGMGNQAADDANAINAVMAAAQAGFPVFVVGIGNVMTAMQTLNAMATAGGKAQTADAMGRVYFPADDPTSLETALSTISGQVLSCNFTLDSVPPDPTNILVFIGTDHNNAIPKDPTNGWSYGPGMMSIIINGSYCNMIKAGTITSVGTIYGCPGVTIIP